MEDMELPLTVEYLFIHCGTNNLCTSSCKDIEDGIYWHIGNWCDGKGKIEQVNAVEEVVTTDKPGFTLNETMNTKIPASGNFENITTDSCDV